jgi:hypothetical protein
MSDGRGLTMSERAIAAREARHKARREGSPTASQSATASRDPWCYAGAPGEWGRPGLDQGPRKASPDLLERAMAAYQFTPPDTRFANLVSRFSRILEW